MTREPLPLLAAGDTPGYWNEARRPLPTLLFVLPFVLVYECGVAWCGAQAPQVRNGADHWMRSWMLDAGLTYAWLLPAALFTGLLAWQIAGRYPWRCSFDTLTGMFGESLLFALLLIVGGQSLNLVFHRYGFETLAVTQAAPVQLPPGATRAISFLGAGIYEEVMFRLALLPLGYYLLRAMMLPRRAALVLAVLISSGLFAAAHYVDPASGSVWSGLWEPLARVRATPALWYGFTFRLFAGLLFSLLLLTRGFGITVGCHALYDLLAGVLMQGPMTEA